MRLNSTLRRLLIALNLKQYWLLIALISKRNWLLIALTLKQHWLPIALNLKQHWILIASDFVNVVNAALTTTFGARIPLRCFQNQLMLREANKSVRGKHFPRCRQRFDAGAR